jgi:acetyl-CoA synthetase
LITTDTIRRRGKEIYLRGQWQKAVQDTNVSRVIIVGRDYDDFIKNAEKAKTEVMDSEDLLFILYTSGTTGEPKGTLQVHGGFTVVAAQQAAYLIDLKPDDVMFCTQILVG